MRFPARKKALDTFPDEAALAAATPALLQMGRRRLRLEWRKFPIEVGEHLYFIQMLGPGMAVNSILVEPDAPQLIEAKRKR